MNTEQLSAAKCREIYARLVPLHSQVLSCYRGGHAVVGSMYSSHFDEFFKFISIKAVYGNDQGTDLSPGFIVDNVWHTVISNPAVYKNIQDICYAVCRRRVSHHPNRARDPKAIIERRYLLTQYIMTKVFGPTWIIGPFDDFCKKRGKGLLSSLRNEPNLGC